MLLLLMHTEVREMFEFFVQETLSFVASSIKPKSEIVFKRSREKNCLFHHSAHI